jgi:hypothetical protein
MIPALFVRETPADSRLLFIPAQIFRHLLFHGYVPRLTRAAKGLLALKNGASGEVKNFDIIGNLR